MRIVDRLIEKTLKTKNPSVIGLDPDMGKIPACYKACVKSGHPLEAAANVIFAFNCDLIDTIAALVPAVKRKWHFMNSMGPMAWRLLRKQRHMQKQKGLLS